MRKKAFKVGLVVVCILLLGTAISAVIVFNKPELMQPGPFHPRALHCRLHGYHVHPWVKIDPTKEYTLKIWATRWPMFRDGYGYDDLIQEVASEFRETYPNVNVEYVLLPLGQVEEAIEKAVWNSTPPNICMAPFDPSLVASGLVVPINMFICDTPREGIAATPAASFEPSSLKSVSINKRLWAWPSWTAVKSWAGNAEILRKVGINVEQVMLCGWTYEDVLTMVDALEARQKGVNDEYRTYGLVLDTASTSTIDALMEAAGRGLVFSGDGSLLWQGECFQCGLSFLEDIRMRKGFPTPVHKMGDKMLELFWMGRAAIIGPVGPGFLRHVRERQDRIAKKHLFPGTEVVEPVLLPVPHPTGSAGSASLTVCGATVFSSPEASGADTDLLAVRFAEALAKREALWLARELPVVPAKTEDLKDTLRFTVPDGATQRFIVEAAISGKTYYNLSSGIKERERICKEQAITPLMDEFWRGIISPGEFCQRLSAFAEEISDKRI